MWSWSLWFLTSLLCGPEASVHVRDLAQIALSNKVLHYPGGIKDNAKQVGLASCCRLIIDK